MPVKLKSVEKSSGNVFHDLDVPCVDIPLPHVKRLTRKITDAAFVLFDSRAIVVVREGKAFVSIAKED